MRIIKHWNENQLDNGNLRMRLMQINGISLLNVSIHKKTQSVHIKLIDRKKIKSTFVGFYKKWQQLKGKKQKLKTQCILP